MGGREVRILLQININTLRIADVDTGSAVAVGYNFFSEWSASAKNNSGFGRLSGDSSALPEAAFSVIDPDLADMTVGEPGEERPRPAEPRLERGPSDGDPPG